MPQVSFPIDEVRALADAACDGTLTSRDAERLECLLGENADARRFYLACIRLDGCLRWEFGAGGRAHEDSGQWPMAGGPYEDAGDFPSLSNPQSPIPNPSRIPPIVIDPTPSFRSPFGSFVFSHVMAALILGIGLLVGLAWRISLPSVEGPSSGPRSDLVAMSVGHITALADCQGRQWSVASGQWSEITNQQFQLGDRFQLVSGLMEIAYDTGARVILEGPCTYEIDSARGGFLVVGKLTARIVASGQWPVASKTKQEKHGLESLATDHRPLTTALFAVRTPTAVVTDLGTEFGVEVEGSGTTRSHVFQGSVEVRENGRRRITSSGPVEVLHAGESVRVERRRNSQVVIIREAGRPGPFVRLIPDDKSPITRSTLLSPASRARVAQYRLIDLGALGGKESWAGDINADGQVVGSAKNSAGISRAYLYKQGTMQDLGLPPELGGEALGVNALGQVVGWSGTRDMKHGRAFLFSDGAIRALGTLGGTMSCANAINDAGQIAGFSKNAHGVLRAFLYTDRDGMKDIGNLYGPKSESCANDINEFGVVSGQSRAPNGQLHAFLYSSVTGMKGLNETDDARTVGLGINKTGQVVGAQTLGPHWKQFACLYDRDAGMKVLGQQEGLYGEAQDINDHGQVVGWMTRDHNSFRAFLWQDGEMLDLNAMIDPASGWQLGMAAAINNAGQIVGEGFAPDGNHRAYLLTPVKRQGARD